MKGALSLLVISGTKFFVTHAFSSSSPPVFANTPVLKNRASLVKLWDSSSDRSEFDYLLGEGRQKSSHFSNTNVNGEGNQKTVKRSRRTIYRLPDSSEAATLTSSATTTVETDNYANAFDDDFANKETEASESEDVYEPRNEDPLLSDYIRKEEQRIAMKSQPISRPPLLKSVQNFMKDKDYSEIVLTIGIPSALIYWLTSKQVRKVGSKINESTDVVLDKYANEMVFHNGDFEELRMCHVSYAKKLLVLGPKKIDTMITRYLVNFAKTTFVTPQSISSLSFVFSMIKFPEDRIAELFVKVGLEVADGASTAGKLLYYGRCILKTKEAKAKLAPIKKIVIASYSRAGTDAKAMMEVSQTLMGESAYRAVVEDAGEKQTSLTTGWEILGIKKKRATEIWKSVLTEEFVEEDVKEEDSYESLVSAEEREDFKKREEEKKKIEETETTSTDNARECGDCGFTLFIAKGREFKFYGDSFKCPECGASKDKFVGVNF